MPIVIKYILFAALAIFLVGAIYAASDIRRKETSNKNGQTPTPQISPTSDISTPVQIETPQIAQVTPTPTTQAQNQKTSTPRNKKTTKKPKLSSRIIIEEEEEEFNVSAWARAGVNEDGSTYAESGTSN